MNAVNKMLISRTSKQKTYRQSNSTDRALGFMNSHTLMWKIFGASIIAGSFSFYLLSQQPVKEESDIKPLVMLNKTPDTTHSISRVSEPEITPVAETKQKTDKAAQLRERWAQARKQKEQVVATKVSQPVKPVVTSKPAAEKPRRAKPEAIVATAETKTIIKKEKRVTPKLTETQIAEHDFREAIKLSSQGNISEAEHRLRKIIRKYPSHEKTYETLAGILINSNRTHNAHTTLSTAVDKFPDNYNLRTWLARVKVAHGDMHDALHVLEESPDMEKLGADGHALLGFIYQKHNKHQDAVASYEKAIETKDNEPKWWLGMAISLESQNASEQALAAYQRAASTGYSNQQTLAFINNRIRLLTNSLAKHQVSQAH